MPERPDKQKNDALLRLTTETARYIVAGLVTTAVNFAVFGLLRPSGISAEVSQAAAITVSVVFAYAANKLYVFRSRAGSVAALALEFLKFIGGRAAAMLVEYYGFILLYPRFGEGLELVAKAIPQAAALAMNYAVSKLLVFTRRRDETKTPEQTGSTEQPNYKKRIFVLIVLSVLTAAVWNNAAVLKALDLFLTGKLSYLIIWAMLALPLLPLIPLVYCAVKLLQNRDPLREPPHKMRRYQRNWLIVILILNSLFYLMLAPCYLSKGRFIYPDAGKIIDACYSNIKEHTR
jgi:putative flippase GtrA